MGVTFECDHPAEARTRTIVSNTSIPEGLTPGQIDAWVRARVTAGDDLYHLEADALLALTPDLVVTQDLCAVCAIDVDEVDRALDHLGCSADVLTVDPGTLDEVLDSVVLLGEASGTSARAQTLVAELRDRLDRLAEVVAGRPRPRLAVIEWTDPPFSAGHWIPDLVTAAGATPTLAERGARSTAITWTEVAAAHPDAIVIAPCGYDLDGATDLALDLLAAGVLPPGVPVWAVDADAAYVRPGPRLVDGAEALAHIAHPDVVSARPDLAKSVPRR